MTMTLFADNGGPVLCLKPEGSKDHENLNISHPAVPWRAGV